MSVSEAGEVRIMAGLDDLKDEVRSLRGAVQDTREEAALTRGEVKAEVKGLRRDIEAVEVQAETNRKELVEQGKTIAAVEATGKHTPLSPESAVKIVAANPSEPPQVKVAKWKAWGALFGLGIPALVGFVLAAIQLAQMFGY